MGDSNTITSLAEITNFFKNTLYKIKKKLYTKLKNHPWFFPNIESEYNIIFSCTTNKINQSLIKNYIWMIKLRLVLHVSTSLKWNSRSNMLYAEMKSWLSPSWIPNNTFLSFFASFMTKFAECWEAEKVFSLNSFRIPHNTSPHFFIEGLECLTGARHWWASLSTLSIALFDAGLLFIIGSIKNIASPSFNFCNACVIYVLRYMTLDVVQDENYASIF